jgi:hypothetical protein
MNFARFSSLNQIKNKFETGATLGVTRGGT